MKWHPIETAPSGCDLIIWLPYIGWVQARRPHGMTEWMDDECREFNAAPTHWLEVTPPDDA